MLCTALIRLKYGLYLGFGKRDDGEMMERCWTTRNIYQDFRDNKIQKNNK